jgi:WD40 repeat protein
MLLGGPNGSGQEPKEWACLRGHTNEVQAIAITPDGKTLVSGGNDKTIKLWDLTTGKERATLRGHRAFVESLAISPDGKTLASGGRDQKIKLWDLATCKELTTLEGHTGGVRSLAFRPDGKLLASGSDDETIKLWDLTTHKEQATLRGNMGWVFCLAFSPDGKTLAGPGRNGMVTLWDVASRKVRAHLFQDNDVILSVVFSPDGKTLAAGGSYRGIRLWEVATGVERARFIGRAPRIRSLALTADGKMLAAGGWEDRHPASVELWDLTRSKKTGLLKGDADSISSVAFTPDGKTLAAAEGPDTTIRLWDVSSLTHVEPSSGSRLSDQKLDVLWADLAGADGSKAYQAIWALTAAGPQAVPWVQERLRPVAPAEPLRVGQLLADLNSDRFAAREQASRELEKLGESAGPLLRKAWSDHPAPETRRRVERLLEKLEQPAASPERLRALRAIEVLEHIGTAEARRVLEQLASGIPQARLTQEARASLECLARRRVDAEQPPPAREQERTDRFGDPLPVGVLTRVASSRMRHNDRLRALALSPDGKLLASGGAYLLRIWDTATGKLERQFGVDSNWGQRITFSADGSILTSVDGYHDLTCRRLDLQTGKELSRFHLDLDGDAGLSPEGALLAVACDGRTVRLFDTASGRKTGEFKIELGSTDCRVAVRPDGKALAIADAKNRAIRIYDIPSGNRLVQLEGPVAASTPLVYSPDGQSLAVNSGGSEDALCIWDPATGKERLRLKGSRAYHTRAHFSRDGKLLAAAGPESRDVGLWNLTTGHQVRRFSGNYTPRLVLFSPEGKTLFGESRDGAIVVWDVATGRLSPTSADPITAVRDLRFDGGKRLIGRADVFHAWDPATGRETQKFPEAPGISDLSPDETLLARSSEDGTIRLLDAATGREKRSWKAHERALWVLRFSADGKRLFSTGGWDPLIRVWDVTTGQRVRELHGHREGETQLAVSPDRRFLAACGNRSADDAELRLWDLNSGRELPRFSPRAGTAHHPVFSPDGRWLAAATDHPGASKAKEEVQVWEVATGKLLCALAGHRETVTALAFSVDSRLLATGSMDRTVRLWELASGQERKRFLGHLGTILSLAFAPDNLQLAASSPDAPLYLWDVAAVTRREQTGTVLADAQREALWKDLENEDPRPAYWAVLALATTPAQTLALMRKNLPPAPLPDLRRLRKLVADLDNPRFTEREQAEAALTQWAEGAAGPQRQALKNHPSPEARRRLARILESLEEVKPERLRAARAVETLELLGTPEALQLLAELASGAPDAHLTREAAAARDRLRGRRDSQ